MTCLRRKESGGHYDRFKGRVLFPIHDSQGRSVAIGGRSLPGITPPDAAKYLNSSESPVYSKSSLLYGLDLAKDAIGHRDCKTAIVMEGYTDCIIARQFGFENVVACCGTALGERQIRLLRRFAERIVLLLDGDEAGQKRTGEILSLFVAEQVDLRIVTLPDELDPCDFLMANGPDAFRAYLDAAVDGLEHAFRTATRGLNIQTQPHEAGKALDGLLQIIAKAPRLREGSTSETRVREWTMLARLARMFDVDEAVLRGRVGELRGKQRPIQAAPAASGSRAQLAGTRYLGSRAAGNLAARAGGDAGGGRSRSTRAVGFRAAAGGFFRVCCSLAAAGITPSFERLLLEFDDPHYKNLLVEMDEQGRARRPTTCRRGWATCSTHFAAATASGSFAPKRGPCKSDRLDPAEELAVLQNMIDQERRRQGISAPTDG